MRQIDYFNGHSRIRIKNIVR